MSRNEGLLAQAGADADRMDGHARFPGGLDRIAGRIVDAVGEQDDRGDFGRGELLRRRRQGPRHEVALPVGVKAGRLFGPVERVGLLGKGDQPQAEVALEFSHHFASLSRAWSNRVMPVASSAMLIEADVSSRKTSAGLSDRRFSDSSAPAETGASRSAESPPPAAQQRPPLLTPQRAERPTIKRPRQQDRRGGNRQHRRDAVTLGEGEVTWGGVGDRG